MTAIEYDVAVIGAGITGCLAARRLAGQGARVALLDAGPDPSQASFREQSIRNPKRQHIQSQVDRDPNQTALFLVDDVDHPYICPEDAPFLWFRGRQIGGLLHLWDGCCPRLTNAQLTKPREDGAPTWPISYAELEPYYIEAEKALKVQQTQLSDSEARLEVAISREFPEACVISRPVGKLKFHDLRRELGALESLTLMPNTVVHQLVLSQAGDRIERIRYIDCGSGKLGEITSNVVMLCASTLESACILLQSATVNCPGGLGNSSGVLGKFLMDHTCAFISPRSFIRDRVRRQFRSFMVRLKRQIDLSHGIYIHREESAESRQYGLEASFPYDGLFWVAAFGEVAPSVYNRISLDSGRRECLGLPVPRIEFRYSDEDRRRMGDAMEFVHSILEIADLAPDNRQFTIATPGTSVHQVGTARMGTAPNNSFLNKFNQSWEVPNLFVTDGSAFPASNYQNPTLTMVALTLRACDIVTSELAQRPSLRSL